MGINVEKTNSIINELTKKINDPLYFSESAVNYFERAMLYFVLGEYKLALDDISVSLSFSPNDPLLHVQKGVILHAYGELKDAILEYDKVLEIDPTFKNVKENKSFLLSQIESLKELVSLSKIMVDNPHDFSLYYERGCLYDDLFDYEKGESDLTMCINLRPTYPPAYNARGVIYSKLKKYKDALKDFDAAIALDSHYEEAYLNKVNIYKAVYNDEKRLETINKLIEKNPKSVVGYYEKGIYYKELKNIKEAITFFQKSIEISPEFKKAINELKDLNELMINNELIEE